MGLCSCKSKIFKYFQAAAKKKGVKSTLGRIFGKKDKQLKSMKDPHGSPYVTMPLSNSPSGGFAPPSVHPMAQHPSNMYVGECDMSSSESMGTGLGGLAGKGDFDRRKKKRFFRF
jgi:hypothetical protein